MEDNQDEDDLVPAWVLWVVRGEQRSAHIPQWLPHGLQAHDELSSVQSAGTQQEDRSCCQVARPTLQAGQLQPSYRVAPGLYALTRGYRVPRVGRDLQCLSKPTLYYALYLWLEELGNVLRSAICGSEALALCHRSKHPGKQVWRLPDWPQARCLRHDLGVLLWFQNAVLVHQPTQVAHFDSLVQKALLCQHTAFRRSDKNIQQTVHIAHNNPGRTLNSFGVDLVPDYLPERILSTNQQRTN